MEHSAVFKDHNHSVFKMMMSPNLRIPTLWLCCTTHFMHAPLVGSVRL